MSDGTEVKADIITLTASVVGGKRPKLKLKMIKPVEEDVGEHGLDSHPVEPGRNLVIRVLPDPKHGSEIDRLYGCHACGDPDNLTVWTSGIATDGELKRGKANRQGYFTVIARLDDGRFASADPPIVVRPIITPPPPITVGG